MYFQENESLVLAGTAFSKLRYNNINKSSFILKRIHANGDVETFTEAVDFTVDYKNGRIARTHTSKIKDFSENIFFGKDTFNHEGLNEYGNSEYMLFASYDCEIACEESNEHIAQLRFKALKTNKIALFNKSLSKIKYAVVGDSISTGAESLLEEFAYFSPFKKHLEEKFKIEVEVKNFAVGGDTTVEGLSRYQKAVDWKPDLVSIAFGMNDQNLGSDGHFVEPNSYQENLDRMIQSFLSINCAVILISPCSPNPKWHYASGDMALYVDRLIALAKKYHLSIADVNFLWQKELESGKIPEDLLNNNINHPTAYGHGLYATVLSTLA